MASVESSPSSLVIRTVPWLEWLVGAAFIAGGAWPFFSGDRVFGAGFMLAGAAIILVFANTITSTFDRHATRFTRSTRGLVRRSELTYPFDQIVGVRVQASNSGSSPSQRYNVVLVLRSHARVPVSSGYTSGKEDKERLAAEIRRFLGLPQDADAGPPGFGEMVRAMLG